MPSAGFVEPAITNPDEDQPVMKAVGPRGPELDLFTGDPKTAPEVWHRDIGGAPPRSGHLAAYCR